jgi:lysophospholipase L1-like esterase
LVIVMLGTNDARSANQAVRGEVMPDLQALLKTYAALPSAPQLLLCTPLPAFRPNHTVDPAYLSETLVPALRALTGIPRMAVFDLFSQTGDLGPRCADGIHPDAAGTAQIAQLILARLTGAKR